MNAAQKITVGIIIILVLLSNSFTFGLVKKWYFGHRYNNIRLEFNIPVIPEDWSSKNTSSNFIFWYPELKKIHIGKEIETKFISIVSEKDTYQKKNKDLKEQISITRFYESNKNPIIEYQKFNDSIVNSKMSIDFQEAHELIRNWNTNR